MRKMFALIGILGILGVLSSSSTAMAQSEEKRTSQTTLKVEGMSCAVCAATIEKLVKKVEGVASATVSQPKGMADITFDPAKTNAEALVKLINQKTVFKAELVSSHSKK